MRVYRSRWPFVRRSVHDALVNLRGVYVCNRCGGAIPVGWAHGSVSGHPGCAVIKVKPS